MTQVSFYFDPACPWAWLTSLWIREVRKHRPLDIQWRFFSLAEVNELEPIRYGLLRISALARREGGNDAVDRSYLALGRMVHEHHIKFKTNEELQQAAASFLADVGLDPTLAKRALEDDSTLEDVLSDHREVTEKLGAFGVPWLVIEEGSVGFFGPVVARLLEPEEALDLWDHFIWLESRPYLYELKRGRDKLPDLEGLSASFSVPVPTAG